MLQKSYTIGPESGGIVESAKESNLATVQMSARPAVIAQGNWKFVEQLLQVKKKKIIKEFQLISISAPIPGMQDEDQTSAGR